VKLVKLASIRPGRSIPIKNLSAARLTELQIALTKLGYPVGDIHGLYGPRTRSAWGEAVADLKLGSPDTVEAPDIAKLQKALDRSTSQATLNFSTKAGTIRAIKSECSKQGIGLKTQIAYVLATTDHETAHTFQPVSEAFWVRPDPEAWRRKHLRYYPYYGRGYVQLTWENNYRLYGSLLGLDLVRKPDLALDPRTALFVLVHGFRTGRFTGRKLSDYVDAHHTDFLNARRCINGTDKQAEIAALAKSYLARL
jgi:predicted chitinase